MAVVVAAAVVVVVVVVVVVAAAAAAAAVAVAAAMRRPPWEEGNAADEAGVGVPETAVVQCGAACRVMEMRLSSRSVKFS